MTLSEPNSPDTSLSPKSNDQRHQSEEVVEQEQTPTQQEQEQKQEEEEYVCNNQISFLYHFYTTFLFIKITN